MKNEREIALDILTEIVNEGAYGNISLRRTLGRYGDMAVYKKAFITEIVNGSLRSLILIDYYIDSFSKISTTKMKPFILAVLRISVYQLLFMDKTPASAICNSAVNMTKARGFHNLAGFVNGVLRSIDRNRNNVSLPDREREPDRYLSVTYSFPLWLVRYWMDNYGLDDAEGICNLGSRSPSVGICANLLKTEPSALKEELRTQGMEVSDGQSEYALSVSHTGDIGSSSAFKAGKFHVMDESAMLAVRMLDPRPGQTVMDVCAAPGGKSFYSAYLMENIGRIIAWDIHPTKLKLLNESAKRLGIGIISCEEYDARVPRPDLYGTADRLLVDAPCSGLGIVRKKPDIKYVKDMAAIEALSAVQKELLAACGTYVKPGGALVYCTCTVTREENDKIAEWFTHNYPFVQDDIDRFLPKSPSIRKTGPGTVQLLPGENSDGFFIARFIRKE